MEMMDFFTVLGNAVGDSLCSSCVMRDEQPGWMMKKNLEQMVWTLRNFNQNQLERCNTNLDSKIKKNNDS